MYRPWSMLKIEAIDLYRKTNIRVNVIYFLYQMQNVRVMTPINRSSLINIF